MRRTALLQSATAVLLLSGSAFGSTVVTDPYFLNPSIAPGSFEYASTINAAPPPNLAWTYNPDTGIVANGSVFGNPNAPGGGPQAAFVQGNGILAQIIGNWTAGTYTVTFDSALRAWDAVQPGGYQSFDVVLTTGNTETVLATCGVNGTNGCSGLTIGYKTVTLAPFTVTAGVHTLAFQGLSSEATAFLSNVSVTDPAVPEPATFGLLGFGLAIGLLGYARKRN